MRVFDLDAFLFPASGGPVNLPTKPPAGEGDAGVRSSAHHTDLATVTGYHKRPGLNESGARRASPGCGGGFLQIFILDFFSVLGRHEDLPSFQRNPAPMRVTLKLPRVSMNMEMATITKWHRRPGETFAAGQPLYEIETEKTSTDIEAPAAGVLIEILAEEGANIEAGTEVCRIEVANDVSGRRSDR